MGAEYTEGKRAAEAVFQSVPIKEMGRAVTLVVEEFENSQKEEFEEFSKEVLNRFSPEFLSLWFMAKLESGCKEPLRTDMDEMDLLEKCFSGKKYLGVAKESGYDQAANEIVRAMWYEQEAPEVYHVDVNKRRSR
ncbi:MAG: hypothetical protein L3J42_04955 [Hydrogenimonas sp.]|nr:hypothetical protein [Hydrogenimonas sp.]